MNRKWVRITVGAVLLLFLIVTLVPRLYLSNSSDGVVNARLITLRTPIEGRVEYTVPVRHGTFFKEGESIGQVVNERADSGLLRELETEKITLEARVELMRDRLEKFRKLHERLSASLEKYSKFSIIQIEKLLRQNDAQLSQERAERERSKRDFEGNLKLLSEDVGQRREVDNSEAAYRKSLSRMTELENRREELNNSLEAIRNGVFLSDGNNDVPYSSQRMDQLVIEMALAESVLNESLRRLSGIDKQIAAEKEHLDRMRSYPIKAPVDCLVWRIPSPAGSSVAINSELLVLISCPTLFIDAAVTESMFSDIAPGEEVKYRLNDEPDYIKGIVTAMVGSGADAEMYESAAKLAKDPRRDFRVWIRANPEKIGVSPSNFYKVGHRVTVKFPKKWRLWEDIVRFFNVF